MDMGDQVITVDVHAQEEEQEEQEESPRAVMHRTAADPPAALERRPGYRRMESWYVATAVLVTNADPLAAAEEAARAYGRVARRLRALLRARARARRPLRHLEYDLEAGGQAHREDEEEEEELYILQEDEEEEEDKMLRDIISQAYPALLAASTMSYSAFKDAPEHVKVIIFGGLVIIYIVLIAGMLSRSLARRQLAFRLVSCSAATLLTFSVATQLSEPTYIIPTALVGGLLNLLIMLLRF